MADLTDALGVAPPPELDALTDTERARLAELVERAARKRATALDEATEHALRFIPKLLRGTVRRALGM